MTALELNRLGFTVFAGVLNSKGNGANTLIRESMKPSRMIVLQMDVTNDSQVSKALSAVTQFLEAKKCLEESWVLHAVINNAGIIKIGEIEWGPEGSVEEYQKQLDVNLMGMVRVTRRFLPLIRKSRGRIINLSSIMSQTNVPGINGYCVSKAAAAKFSEGLQSEVSRFGVTVVDVKPWFYRTPLLKGEMVSRLSTQLWNQTLDHIKKEYGQESYFEDFVKRMLFMCTDCLNVIQRPEDVVDSLVDAVTSGEPNAVYRVITPGFGVFFSLINDWLPWDLVFPIRRMTDKIALSAAKKRVTSSQLIH
jgi:3-hydroxybutyrate dehydrogenase